MYRCNLVKLRVKQCDDGIYLQFDSRSDKVTFFRSDTEHIHASEQTAVFKFSIAAEAANKEIPANGLKPKAIKYNLVKKGFDAPSRSKLKIRYRCDKDKINL